MDIIALVARMNHMHEFNGAYAELATRLSRPMVSRAIER